MILEQNMLELYELPTVGYVLADTIDALSPFPCS